jgi:transposase-like protein
MQRRKKMECPICKKSKHIEIDTHSDGFAQNLQECGDCGALWTRKDGKTIIVHGATKRAA